MPTADRYPGPRSTRCSAALPMLVRYARSRIGQRAIQLDDRAIPDADLFITEIGIYPQSCGAVCKARFCDEITLLDLGPRVRGADGLQRSAAAARSRAFCTEPGASGATAAAARTFFWPAAIGSGTRRSCRRATRASNLALAPWICARWLRMKCAADLHALKVLAREASLNQGIPEPTTRKTLGENYSRISAVTQCRTRAKVRARNSSHTSGARPGERPASW